MAAPSKLTAEVRVKLQEAAALDASVEEMAYYCDVSRQTIYDWMKKDQELSDKIERLRQKPVLAARRAAIKGSTETYSNAMDFLKRKRKDEFGDNATYTVELPEPLLGGKSNEYGADNNSNSKTASA